MPLCLVSAPTLREPIQYSPFLEGTEMQGLQRLALKMLLLFRALPGQVMSPAAIPHPLPLGTGTPRPPAPSEMENRKPYMAFREQRQLIQIIPARASQCSVIRLQIPPWLSVFRFIDNCSYTSSNIY